MTKATDVGKEALPRFGLLASDALRVLGLSAILGDGERCEIVPLSIPGSGDTTSLRLMLIDSPDDGSVLELVAACRRFRPHMPVMVLGSENDPAHIERVIGAGAKGYLHHAASEGELKMAIDVVLDGSVWAPRKVLARLLDRNLASAAASNEARTFPAEAPPPVQFTPREQEVLRLLVLGHPNRQIAQVLGVDEGTVKAHMGRLLRKAGVDNRTALSMRALERGWARPH